MEELLAGLRAAGEDTRLRLLHLLSRAEFNVSELTQILGQSQPRVSRHLKLMMDAGLLDRFKEGSWVLFRMREEGRGAEIAAQIVAMIPRTDPILRRDLARVGEILQARREVADAYFDANAKNWDEMRSLHISQELVEQALLDLIGKSKVNSFVDVGTGTGRVLELLAPLAKHATGVDASREMLAIARAHIASSGLSHTQVRQGDIFALPFDDDTADLMTIHQVLHFLDNPSGVLEEASRVLAPNGRLVIVDFAPHSLEFLRDEHAHRRLGLSNVDITRWCARAGLSVDKHETLPSPNKEGLTVSLWACRKNDAKT